MEEAEVDSVVREAILHAIGDTPWADAKARWTLPCRRCKGAAAVAMGRLACRRGPATRMKEATS